MVNRVTDIYEPKRELDPAHTPAEGDGGKVESVRFTALNASNVKSLKTPTLTALLTINGQNFEVGTPVDRFVTMIDELYELNPHGKVTIEQITRAYNAAKRKDSGCTDVQKAEMREIIELYRNAICVLYYGDDVITTVDNRLVDITRETQQLRINNQIVEEYYYIHRPSLIKIIAQEHPNEEYVSYFWIPYNWLDMGFRATPANNAIVFMLSKLIATHAPQIELDRIYEIAKAETPKQRLDTRKKVEKLLEYHKSRKDKDKAEQIETPLKDYAVLDPYDQDSSMKDPEAAIIELQYKDDDGE